MGSLNERMARCEGVGNERQFEMRPQMGAFPKIANCKLPVLSNIERNRACSNIDIERATCVNHYFLLCQHVEPILGQHVLA